MNPGLRTNVALRGELRRCRSRGPAVHACFCFFSWKNWLKQTQRGCLLLPLHRVPRHPLTDCYLPQSSKSWTKACVRPGAIPDPGGELGERRRSRVAPVAQHHGGVVATVTDSSPFGQMRLVVNRSAILTSEDE